jgi:hypothetical protein
VSCQSPSHPEDGSVLRLDRTYQRTAARLLDTYTEATRRGQPHSIDHVIPLLDSCYLPHVGR